MFFAESTVWLQLFETTFAIVLIIRCILLMRGAVFLMVLAFM